MELSFYVGVPSWGAPSTHLTIFFENPQPKLMPPMEHPHLQPPPLKNEAPPSRKQKTTLPPPPSLKHETPFHEMISRNNTINNNFESS